MEGDKKNKNFGQSRKAVKEETLVQSGKRGKQWWCSQHIEPSELEQVATTSSETRSARTRTRARIRTSACEVRRGSHQKTNKNLQSPVLPFDLRNFLTFARSCGVTSIFTASQPPAEMGGLISSQHN